MIKTIQLFTIQLFCFLPFWVFAQCPSVLNYTTQQQIDSFAFTHPGCDSINQLTISGTSITNLQGLASLRVVGSLTIQNTTQLESLQGLGNLIGITQNFTIKSNKKLKSLSGVDNLYAIKGNFTVTANDSLQNMLGLGHLENIGGQTDISLNPSLVNFFGLNQLRNFWGLVNISSNEKFQNFVGLDSCVRMNNNFTIKNNVNLLNFQGLEHLDTIGNHLTIENNPRLLNLQGLGNIKLVGGDFSIKGDSSLLETTDFLYLAKISGSLFITENQFLEHVGTFSSLETVTNVTLNNLPNLDSLSGNFSVLSVAKAMAITNCGLQKIQDFINLEGLNDLNINNNTALWTIGGFSSLKSVETFSSNVNNFGLTINNNAVLKEIKGFDTLTLCGNVLIQLNNELERVVAFENLERVSKDFTIINNPALVELPGFHKLATARTITISDNAQLPFLTGFSGGFSSLVVQIKIENNARLGYIDAFKAAKSIGLLEIKENPMLTMLTGFDSLVSVRLIIDISENAQLDRISGFYAMETGYGDGLDIINNPVLTSIYGFQKLQSIPLIRLHNLPLLGQLPLFSSLKAGLEIEIRACHSLTTLQGLDSLRSANQLIIENNQSLASLYGVGNLQKITPDTYWGTTTAGQFLIENNPNLTTLSHLSTVGDTNHVWTGHFVLKNNNRLENLYGLHRIQKFSETLRIEGNDALTSLFGLDDVRIIKDLIIAENPVLTNFEGLGKLKQIWQLFKIENNASLFNFKGLDSLDFAQSLFIFDNQNVQTLDGLGQLVLLNGDLQVKNNPNLESLLGLKNLEEIKKNVTLENNPKLEFCSQSAICNTLNTTGHTVQISGNALACENPFEVSQRCGLENSAMTGSVFFDMDCDSMYTDSVDILSKNHLILDNSTHFPIAATSQQGLFFRFINDNQSYSISAKPLGVSMFSPSVYSIASDSATRLFPDLDFFLCPDLSDRNIQVLSTRVGAPPRPGFQFQMRICVLNESIVPENGNLEFELLPPNLNLWSISDADGGQINGNKISWSFQDLNFMDKFCVTITFRVAQNAPIGSVLHYITNANLSDTSIQESNTEDNQIEEFFAVRGSYDPNNKTSQSHNVQIAKPNENGLVDYTVRFQNTGNFPAEFIEIFDTLSPKLDIGSIQMLDASHDFTLHFPDENVLKWRFDNIQLPDSTSDPLGSQGFLRFTIQTKDSLTYFDKLNNAVAIYFDYNDPVFTDTAMVWLCPPMNIHTFSVAAKCAKPNGLAGSTVQGPQTFSYLWNTGHTSPKIGGLNSALYNVTITGDSSVCWERAYVWVDEIVAPQLSLMNEQMPSCSGSMDGLLELEVLDGTPPFLVHWSTLDTALVLVDVPMGTYQAFLRDAKGCLDTLNVQLNDPSQLDVQGNVSAQTDMQNPNGAIQIIAMGGTGQITVLWEDGNSEFFRENLMAGTYNLTLTDANGCTESASFTVDFLVKNTEPLQANSLGLYPNPVVHTAFLEQTELGQVVGFTLLNELGQELFEKKKDIQKTEEIDMSIYATGIYWLKIQLADGHLTYRALVK